MKTLLFILLSQLFFNIAFAANKNLSFMPQAFRAKYEQQYKSSLSGKIKKSWGMLDYEYPSKIRLETQKPDKIVFISNNQKTWYYTAPFIEGEQGELTVRSTKKNSLSYFFDALKAGLTSNKEYDVKAVPQHGQLIEFKETLIKELGINKAMLKFKKSSLFKDLETIELFYANGKQVLIKLQYLDIEQDYPKDFFTFYPPKNTRINK